MKKLKPSLREKKRYIAFRVESGETYGKDAVVREILSQTLGFFGECTASDFNLWIVDFNKDTQEGFLVCNHKSVGKIKACLGLIGYIGDEKVHLKTLGVSGTIKSLRRKFLNKRPIFKSEKKEGFFIGKKVEIVRSMGECVDALPRDKELQGRLKRLKVKYLGLMKNDLGGKENAAGTQHGI
jgi:ribonuclease P/MRP protein subunit POP5